MIIHLSMPTVCTNVQVVDILLREADWYEEAEVEVHLDTRVKCVHHEEKEKCVELEDGTREPIPFIVISQRRLC